MTIVYDRRYDSTFGVVAHYHYDPANLNRAVDKAVDRVVNRVASRAMNRVVD